MEETFSCLQCHTTVKATDYFCFNCGKNLKPKPPSTTVFSISALFFKSLLLPPMGFFWGYKYLCQTDTKSKVIGIVTIAGTVILLILTIQATLQFAAFSNLQMQKDLKQLGY